MRQLEGRFYLAQDLVFADHQRVEARRNAQQVAGRLFAAPGIQDRARQTRRRGLRFEATALDQAAPDDGLGIRASPGVDLGAIASRQDRHFGRSVFTPAAVASAPSQLGLQAGQRDPQPLRPQRQALPHLHRGHLVIHAHHTEIAHRHASRSAARVPTHLSSRTRGTARPVRSPTRARRPRAGACTMPARCDRPGRPTRCLCRCRA